MLRVLFALCCFLYIILRQDPILRPIHPNYNEGCVSLLGCIPSSFLPPPSSYPPIHPLIRPSFLHSVVLYGQRFITKIIPSIPERGLDFIPSLMAVGTFSRVPFHPVHPSHFQSFTLLSPLSSPSRQPLRQRLQEEAPWITRS